MNRGQRTVVIQRIVKSWRSILLRTTRVFVLISKCLVRTPGRP